MLRSSLSRNGGNSRILVGILIFIAIVLQCSLAQSHLKDGGIPKSWACLKRTDLLRDSHGQPVWLASSDLMERVLEKLPIKRPGPLGKNKLQGVVSIEVVINKRGKVICARGAEGHPIAIGAAIDSVRKWTFKPYDVSGKAKSVVGVLTVPYDFAT